MRKKRITDAKMAICAHEAGHAIVALKLGARFAKLELYDLGKRHSGPRGSCDSEHLESKLHTAARGYGGMIAEFLYYTKSNPPDAATFAKLIEARGDLCSPEDERDITNLHPKWRLRAIRLSLNILKKHWHAVEKATYDLVSNHRGLIIVYPWDLEKSTD